MQRKTINITFKTDEITGGLNVCIETDRLYLKSATAENLNDYSKLLGDAEVMAKFYDGKPWTIDKTKTHFGTWIQRWANHDPFSSLAVFKKDDNTFIGHVVLGYGDDKPGQSELAYVFDKKMWGKGFGKEAVSAIVNEYAPELVRLKYKLEGKPFTSIIATTRPDNVASFKILKNSLGMESIKEEVKYGNIRHTFFISTSQLCNKVNCSIENNNVNVLKTRSNTCG